MTWYTILQIHVFISYLKKQIDAALIIAVVALRIGQTLALIEHLIVEERVAIEGALQLLVERVHVQLLDAVLLEVLEAGRVQHANRKSWPTIATATSVAVAAKRKNFT